MPHSQIKSGLPPPTLYDKISDISLDIIGIWHISMQKTINLCLFDARISIGILIDCLTPLIDWLKCWPERGRASYQLKKTPRASKGQFSFGVMFRQVTNVLQHRPFRCHPPTAQQTTNYIDLTEIHRLPASISARNSPTFSLFLTLGIVRCPIQWV